MNPKDPETWSAARAQHACLVFGDALATWLSGFTGWQEGNHSLERRCQDYLDGVIMKRAEMPPGRYRVTKVGRNRPTGTGLKPAFYVRVEVTTAIDRLAALADDTDA